MRVACCNMLPLSSGFTHTHTHTLAYYQFLQIRSGILSVPTNTHTHTFIANICRLQSAEKILITSLRLKRKPVRRDARNLHNILFSQHIPTIFFLFLVFIEILFFVNSSILLCIGIGFQFYAVLMSTFLSQQEVDRERKLGGGKN